MPIFSNKCQLAVEIAGHVLPALPVPVVAALRNPGERSDAPRVGEGNEAIIRE